MKRIKERWDLEFPKQESISTHNLRNNASRFQKGPKIRNLILVRNTNEIDQQKDRVYEDTTNQKITFVHEDERDRTQNGRVREASGLID